MNHSRKDTNLLLIDYDSTIIGFIDSFIEKYDKVCMILPFKVIKAEVYKTRAGHHIELWIDRKLMDYETVFFQLFFGSDDIRELFNIGRVRRKEKDWNKLYSAKYDNERKIFVKRELLKQISSQLSMDIREVNEKCQQTEK